MNLTTNILHAVMPRAPAIWLPVMVEELPKAGIDTSYEIASFVAQIAHESNDLTHLEERLSYSAERLMVVWPRRFPSYEIAQKYERNPERLANFVYANRMGNGSELSGDGWRWRGRGPTMLTGHDNHAACGDDIGEDLLNHPELLLTPYVGTRSALWFWKTRGLDAHDDDDDVRIETRKINGGETGLAQRQAIFNRCFSLLEAA